MAYDVSVRLGVDGEKAFRSSIDAINANLKSMGSELKAVTAQFAKNADSEEALTAKNQVLAKSVAATKEKIGVLDKELERQAEKLRLLGNTLDEVTRAHGKESQEALKAQNAYNNQVKTVAKLQTQLNGAKAELAGMEDAVRDNQEAIDGLGREVEDAGDAFAEAGDSAISFGDILKANIISDFVVEGIRRITDGLMDFARFSLESGMNFEAQMSRVQAISGASGDDAERLAEKAKAMGESTVFSATESAQALEYMAMAGWKTDDMLDGLAGVMNLAAASGEDLAATSDIVTDALTAFGLTAADSTHFADVLAVASSNANTNVGMMGETFKYVAPVAGAMGYNVEDVAVAIGLMANNGIKASQAGTSLRGALTHLAKPTESVWNALSELGLALSDTTDDFEGVANNLGEYNAVLYNNDGTTKSFSETIEALRNAFSDLSEGEKTFYASTLFGTEAMSGMLGILNSSDDEIQKLSSAIADADGAAQEMAETMTDNLSGSLTLMQSAAEGVGISLYEKVKEPLTEIVNDITNDALPSVQQFIDSVDTEDITAAIYGFLGAMQMLTPVIAGATAAMVAYKTASAISGVIDKLKIATQGQTVAQAALNAVMNANHFVQVATAIVGLTAGFVTLYKTNETFRNKVNAAWNSVVSTWNSATTTISGGVSRIQKFFAFDIPNAGKKSLAWFQSIPEQMKQVGRDLLTYLWNGINDKVEWLKSRVRGIGDSIKSIFTGGSDSSAKSGGGTGRRMAAPALVAAEPADDDFLWPPKKPSPSPAPFSANGLVRSLSDAEAGTRMLASVHRVRQDVNSAVGGVAGYYSARQNRSGNLPPENGGNGPDHASMVAAFREAMEGMGVTLDGRKVGTITAVHQSNMGRAFGTA